MEKDNDLPETGTKGVGLKVCRRLTGNGSIIETTERDLLHSIYKFCVATCKKSYQLLFHELNDGCFTTNLIYTSPADKQRRSDKDVIFL